jgi:hypothetical protein
LRVVNSRYPETRNKEEVTRGRIGDFLLRVVKAMRRNTISTFWDFKDQKVERT